MVAETADPALGKALPLASVAVAFEKDELNVGETINVLHKAAVFFQGSSPGDRGRPAGRKSQQSVHSSSDWHFPNLLRLWTAVSSRPH
jgi:hypothetical protein